MSGDHEIAHGGTTLHRLALPGSTIAEVAYPPGLQVPIHTHDHAHIGFLIGGSCRETVGGRAYDYEPAQLIVKTSGESHSNSAGDSGTRFLIVDVAAAAAAPPEIFVARAQFREASFALIMRKILSELRAPDDVTVLASEGLVLELFAQIARVKARRTRRSAPGWIERARELLHDHARESLSISGAAKELGIHPTHFARAFRRHVGVTPGEYVRSIRLANAMALLENSDRPIVDIAREAGFSDQSHLTRAVRRATGSTPAEYRRRVGR